MVMKVSSIAVFNSDGKLLFGKRADSGKWTLPGGKAEEGESPEATAERELFEEAGIHAQHMGYLGCGQPYEGLIVHAFKAISDATPTGKNDPDKEVDYWNWKWVDVTDGVPSEILDNLHAPKNVVLGLLGYQQRQPEPEMSHEETSESCDDLDEEVELSKAEEGLQLTEELRLHDHLLPPAFRGAHLLSQTRGQDRVVRLMKGADCVAELAGQLGDEHGRMQALRVDDRWQGRGVPVVLRRAFADLVKAERKPKEVDPEVERLWSAFYGPAGGKPDLQALTEAKHIPERIWAEAMKPAAMQKRPDSVLALMKRPDVDGERLDRFSAGARVMESRMYPDGGQQPSLARQHNLVRLLAGVATHDRAWSNTRREAFNRMMPYSQSARPVAAETNRAIENVMARPDLDAQTWGQLAGRDILMNGNARPSVEGAIKSNPERMAALRDHLMNNGMSDRLSKFPGIRFTPEQAQEMFSQGLSTSRHQAPYYHQRHVFQNQPNDIPSQALHDLWNQQDSDGEYEWTPEHVKRLPAQVVADRIKDLPPYSYRGFAGVQHPDLTEDQVRAAVDRWAQPTKATAPPYNDKPGEVPRSVLAAKNISPEYRRELWGRMDALQRREALKDAPKELISDYLDSTVDPRYHTVQAFEEAMKNPHVKNDVDFWRSHLQPGKNFLQLAQTNPQLLMQLSHLPLAKELMPSLKASEPMRRNLDWNGVHEDLVRAAHAENLDIGRPDTQSVYDARRAELGLINVPRLTVRQGTTKLRQLRALAADRGEGGSVSNQELKERGINLGAMGLGRLLDSKGNLTAKAVDDHIASLPATDWSYSHSTWGGLQRHNRGNQKVFQLNITPERRRELESMGLADTYDAMLKQSAGHPVHKRHGAGWVRYTDGHDGVHIDEIQTDMGPNTVKALKENAARAQAKGIDPHKVAQVSNYLWQGKHPSEVMHEAFLQHLRENGRIHDYVHMWQLKPKMKISGQDPKVPAPAHMKETYDKQPPKMGYKEGTYGELATQSNTRSHGGKPTWKQLLKREDDGFDNMRARLAQGYVVDADVIQLQDHDVPVPADVQAKVLGLDWDGWVAPVAALIKRPDVPRPSWQTKFDAKLQERQPSDFVELFLSDGAAVRTLSPEQSQAALDYCVHEGITPKALLRHGKLSEEALVGIAKRSSTLSTIEAAMNNASLGKEGRDRIWKDVDPADKPDLASRVPLDAKDFDEALREPVGSEGLVKLMRGAAEQPGVGHEDWKRWLQPGGVLHEPLTEEPRLLNAVPEHVLRNDHLAQELLPAMRSYASQEQEYVRDSNASGWYDHVSDTTLKRLGEAQALPHVSGNDHWDTRLYKLGLRDGEHVDVRPGLNKLRKLRDLIDSRGGVVSPKELGINLSAQGLGNLLDKQGMLTSNALQQHIDSQPAMRYSHSQSDWDGPQRHSNESSQVFQLNMSREQLQELERQGLTGVYHGLGNRFHPNHQGHGVGWVRYTEKPDGVHIDEIQTDFGHALGQRIKRQDQGKGNVSVDQYQRLHHIMWGDRHPSEILHEAFLQHLRDRGDKTGDEGKEIHVWQLQPKMVLSGQDTGKPAPVHMKQTYDEQPKKMGYKPDHYGVLETHGEGMRRVTGPDGEPTLFKPQGAPTWSQRLSKAFELDALAYLADNGTMLLNKSLGKKLMGLAAATAMHVMPTGIDDKGQVPRPPEVQRVKDVFGTAPMTGADQQSVAVATAPRKWSAKGLDEELHPIAHLESSFGANVNHVPNKTDWNTAFGALGFKPMTGHFEYMKSKTLQKLYPGLEHEDQFSHRFKADPAFYNAIANSHFGWLKRTLGGDPEKAALAWRYGLGAVQQAPDLAALDQEGYGTKYRAIMARKVAHRVAMAPAAVNAAIDSVLDKGEA